MKYSFPAGEFPTRLLPTSTGAVKSTVYDQLLRRLRRQRRTWLVTGAAGFIGSHLVETLLRHGQAVVGLDNLSTGKESNLDDVRALVPPAARARLRFIRGDITEAKDCRWACRGVDYVLHQAALGSVPRSLEQPLETHASNVTGFVNLLVAARDAQVRRLVYASSSSVYGDAPGLPKREARIGPPLSPYAVTKRVDELYAAVFARCYGMELIGLRYFNVFGPRQDPEGAYAAVIPKWVRALLRREPVRIHGDGRTSRDFCFVANAVQANLLAATTAQPGALDRVYNVAVQQRTTLNALFQSIRRRLAVDCPELGAVRPTYGAFRAGDVRHSLADIRLARRYLGYRPTHSLAEGLDEALGWYRQHLG